MSMMILMRYKNRTLSGCNGLFPRRDFCVTKDSKKYTRTMLIPKSSMPIRRKPSFDEELLKSKKFADLYSIQSKRNGEKYVLHDGPPYANGSLHFGHVINKTLKDILNRYRIKKGQAVNYVPGWDCHGLPIEMKVYQEFPELLKSKPLQIIEKARKQADQAIREQLSCFQRLGIIADWNNPYITMSKDYVTKELKAFSHLYSRGLIFRDTLPVYFSPSSQTTLAESELEYNQSHTSPSIYVRYKITSKIHDWNEDLYALIWTTTPWTLFDNQAIAYRQGLRYVIAYVRKYRTNFLVARELIPSLEKKLNTNFIIKLEVSPFDIKKLTYSNPTAMEHAFPFLSSNHVTGDKGTGLVHIAPHHGREDFYLARTNNIPFGPSPVNRKGCFENIHPAVVGKSVIDEGSRIAKSVFADAIIHEEDYKHSYPYDWRTHKPVIIMTSNQWFFNVESVRNDCINGLEQVKFYPEGIKNKILDDLQRRPPWCISRQRVWGIPIPVLFDTYDNPIVSPKSVDYLCSLIEKEGLDCWWRLEPYQLLPPETLRELSLRPDEIRKGEDIFDVWFDSGLSWSMLEGKKVSEVYLEGLDQCKGWFQSSLILSTALRKKPPYKKVYVHGFAVDSKGHKMSKSLGNIVDPLPLLKEKYGADALRFYVAKYATSHNTVPIDNDMLGSNFDELNKIRGKLRFIQAASNYLVHTAEYKDMKLVDHFMLYLLKQYADNCQEFYDDLNIKGVVNESVEIIDVLSSYYLKICKDRLYCDPATSIGRISCQTVLSYSLEILSNFMSPILPFLFEEMSQMIHPKDDPSSCFLKPWFDARPHWKNPTIIKTYQVVSIIRNFIEKNSPDSKHYTKPYDVGIFCEKETDERILKEICQTKNEWERSELAELLQVPVVEINHVNKLDKTMPTTLSIEHEDLRVFVKLDATRFFKCPRCFLHLSESENRLCRRCLKVIPA